MIPDAMNAVKRFTLSHGRRVAIERRVTPAQSREPGVWLLENFLPLAAAAAAKK